MRGTRGWQLVLALVMAAASVATAAEVRVIGTHNALFSLDGTRLGAYPDHTPLIVKNVAVGAHKLYAKSLLTDELQLYSFTIDEAGQKLKEWRANFAPPKAQRENEGGGKNQQARNRTLIGGLAVVNEVAGDKSDARQNRRAALVGAAVVNEVVGGRKHDRKTSKAQGNTIEVKSTVPLDVNLDGQGAKEYKAKAKIVFTHLAPGGHKIFLRNRTTGELKVFGATDADDPSKPALFFPDDGTCTITINPEFAPPKGETVNAKARRRTGLLGAAALNELIGRKKKGDDKEKVQDRRKVLLGATVVNEVIPTNAGRHRKAVTLDFANLPADLPTTVQGTVERKREATVKGAKPASRAPAAAPAPSSATPAGANSLTGGTQPASLQGLIQKQAERSTRRGFLGKLFGSGGDTKPPAPAPEGP